MGSSATAPERAASRISTVALSAAASRQSIPPSSAAGLVRWFDERYTCAVSAAPLNSCADQLQRLHLLDGAGGARQKGVTPPPFPTALLRESVSAPSTSVAQRSARVASRRRGTRQTCRPTCAGTGVIPASGGGGGRVASGELADVDSLRCGGSYLGCLRQRQQPVPSYGRSRGSGSRLPCRPASLAHPCGVATPTGLTLALRGVCRGRATGFGNRLRAGRRDPYLPLALLARSHKLRRGGEPCHSIVSRYRAVRRRRLPSSRANCFSSPYLDLDRSAAPRAGGRGSTGGRYLRRRVLRLGEVASRPCAIHVPGGSSLGQAQRAPAGPSAVVGATEALRGHAVHPGVRPARGA
jgi:hypothetical protein